MPQTMIRRQLTAAELLQSLAVAIGNDDASFEFTHEAKATLEIYWRLDDQAEMQITSKAYYDIICDCDGTTIDIDTICIEQISMGDGYDNDPISVSGINEHSLALLLTKLFDKHNDGTNWDEDDYCVNLRSEYATKRGSNWVLLSEAA